MQVTKFAEQSYETNEQEHPHIPGGKGKSHFLTCHREVVAAADHGGITVGILL